MTIEYLPSNEVADSGSARRLSDRLGSVGLWLATWLDTCADHWAAAAMYQQLSVLSDAELAQRGLSRATLAHDVLAANHAIPRRAEGKLQRRNLCEARLAQDVTGANATRRWRRSIT